MADFPLSHCILVIITFWGSVLVVLAAPSTMRAIPSVEEYGVVLEKVGKLSAPEKAGVKPGDLLLRWQRLPSNHSEGEMGNFDSVFTWLVFLDEQAPRGAIKVFGERDGAKRVFDVSLGDWSGTEVRPVMTPDTLVHYRRGKEFVAAGNVEAGIAEWEKILQDAALRSDLTCWLKLQIGKTWAERGIWGKADAALDAALALADHPLSHIAVWGTIAKVREKQNLLDEAEDAYCKQAEIWKTNRGEGLGFANSLNLMGIMARLQGKLLFAEECFYWALTIGEKLAPGSLVIASYLNGLGVVNLYRRELGISDFFLNESLTIWERLAPHSLKVAINLNNLGALAKNCRDFDSAIMYFSSAFSIKEDLIPNSLSLASSINNLGIISLEKGDLDSAMSFFDRAITIKKNIKPGSLDVANSLLNVGAIAKIRGDLNNAEEYTNSALSIMKILAPGSLMVGHCLNNLGVLAHVRGDLKTASIYYRQALAIKENLSPNSLDLARSLNNLGLLANAQGDLDTARDCLDRALAIQRSLAPGSIDVANSLDNLGFIAKSRGDTNNAIAYYEKALVIKKRIAPGSLHLASSFDNLGAIAYERGNLDVAVTHLENALAIQLKLAPVGELAIEIHNGLAKTFYKLNRLGATEAHFKKSLEALESQLRRLGGSVHAQAGYQARKEKYYHDYITLLLSQNRHEDAFNILERARARVLRQMISERDLVLSGPDIPDNLERNRKRITYHYEKVKQELGTLDFTKDPEEVEVFQDQLLEIQSEYDNVIEEIRKASPRLANLRAPTPLNLDQVREILDPGTTMLSYCVTEEKTYLFVVRNGAELAVYTIEKGESYFRDSVREFHEVIKDPDSKVTASMLQTLSIQLFQDLIAPAKQEIEASSRLLVIPDGPLQKLPFNLLLEKNDKVSRYLVEWKPMASVVSATIYAELKQQKTSRTPLVAAFGDPHYPMREDFEPPPIQITSLDTNIRLMERPLEPNLRGFLRDNPNELARLPYTAQEVDAIAKLFPGQTRRYLGEAANERNVKTLGQGPSIIHLACHGWVNDRFPLESALALTINPSFEEGEENGILQAWEIFDNLRINADLVVLSACETGLGKVQGVEGLTGLTRAFQFAGARSIIASYWKVEDQSTSLLMTRFYGYLKKGLPKNEALRQAQIDLIRQPMKIEKPFLFGLFKRTVKRDVSHPYYWAAFQLIGPWD